MDLDTLKNGRYFNFDSTQVATNSVEDWFSQNKGIDIQKHTVDDEH